VRLEEVVFLAGTELRAACWVITNRSVLPLRLTELAITRALSLMAGLADAQMALAINQLNRQAATPFSNLDILRITVSCPALHLKKEMRRVSVRQQLLPAAIS
jgi:hypothetical protein